MLFNPNIPPSQLAVVAGVINPQSATTVQTSTWVDMSVYGAIEAVVLTGAITATGTVDAKLQQATDNAGTSAKDITGKAITQLVAATDGDEQSVINCRADELDTANAFGFVALLITPATAAALIAGLVIGTDADYLPPTPLATMEEVIY
ncbi:MAG TPA: hypothetical protein VND92_08565 [Vicinamibacterales bacterium]|nr:hypothetical protein [Thermomicrobiaceae bacterium]HVB38578.1 hypothetical protein [Vicinamibacterales bacterium]